MFGVIRELRAQGESVRSDREMLVNGFAGEALQELRLDTWINDHGGMVTHCHYVCLCLLLYMQAHFGDVAPGAVLDSVPIEGTSV